MPVLASVSSILNKEACCCAVVSVREEGQSIFETVETQAPRKSRLGCISFTYGALGSQATAASTVMVTAAVFEN